MDWFADNLIETVLIIGIIILIIEVLVLGFGTFFLFFAGLGAVSTAVLMWVNLIPETLLSAILSSAVFSAIYAALLWKQLAKLQKNVDTTRASSDLVGHSFVLSESISVNTPQAEKPTYQFSGIQWQLDAQQDIAAGTLVEVIQVDVGQLLLQAK
jgi:membrane protein implicated in regulation of membrane protease activity